MCCLEVAITSRGVLTWLVPAPRREGTSRSRRRGRQREAERRGRGSGRWKCTLSLDPWYEVVKPVAY